jgi:hypothetical protein
MDKRALGRRMLLNPFDLIGIDGDFPSASVKRDHLSHVYPSSRGRQET